MARQRRGTAAKTTKAAKAKNETEFDKTAKAISQRYGDKAMVKASKALQPDRVSSGIFVFDLATCGGFPHNMQSLLIGDKSAGKSTVACKLVRNMQLQYPDQKVVYIDTEGCISWDSEILDTNTGRVLTAAEIYEGRLPVNVMSLNAEYQIVPMPITNWFDNGIKEVLKVSTVNTSLKVTGNHKFLIYAGKGKGEWVRCDELEEGMLLCRPKKARDIVPCEKGKASRNVARIVGYLLGDGSFGKSNSSPVFTKKDGDLIEDMRERLKLLDVGMVQFSDRHFRLSCNALGENVYGRWTTPNPLMDILRELGLSGASSAEKFIPTSIMNGPPEVVAETITGLYMTDGTINTVRPSIAFSNTSLEMVVQLRHLWSRYGIVARMQEYAPRRPEHSTLYSLTINGVVNLKKANSVLSLIGYKKAALDKWVGQKANRAPHPTIGEYYPEYSTATQRDRKLKRQEYVNPSDVYWEEIVSIEACGMQQTYDFTVDKTHNLMVNDVIVHNTFDSVWAAELGVDTDQLELVRPSSGEMAVDIADGVLGSMETSLVIVDSLAMLAPTKEIDSSAEDAHIGLQARLVNNMIRKLTSGLIRERAREHYVTVLYVNQFRTKIGGFSPTGDPTTMPGGRALDHACTLQLKLKNKENKGRNREGLEMMTHNEHPFQIVKNKICQGPRTGEFTLVRDDDAFPGIGFGEIDNAPTMLAFAKRFGYWTGAGTAQYLEFDDVRIKFAKQEDAVVVLREDKALQAHLWWWLVAHQAMTVKMPDEFIDRLLALRSVYEQG